MVWLPDARLFRRPVFPAEKHVKRVIHELALLILCDIS
jgi:hypothetical protein